MLLRKTLSLATLLFLVQVGTFTVAQNAVNGNEPAGGAGGGHRPTENRLVATPTSIISQERLPAGARVYISPIAGGFDTYLIAGFERKHVPLIVVGDESKADYEIGGVSESDKANWAKMLFLGSAQSAEQASVKITNLRTGAIVFAYSVNKGNSVRGKQSAGEACAKHIKEKIESTN